MAMTKSQKSSLEAMLKDADVEGKKLIRGVLWVNSTVPKYEVGSCYNNLTSVGQRIWGVPVKRFRGKVISVDSLWKEQERVYKLEAVVKSDDKEITTTLVITESEMTKLKCHKVKDNINWVSKVDTSKSESISLSISGNPCW